MLVDVVMVVAVFAGCLSCIFSIHSFLIQPCRLWVVFMNMTGYCRIMHIFGGAGVVIIIKTGFGSGTCQGRGRTTRPAPPPRHQFLGCLPWMAAKGPWLVSSGGRPAAPTIPSRMRPECI